MVRLKELLFVRLGRWQLDFNSTMVRLKGGQKYSRKPKKLNFNSTMVRLKDRNPPRYRSRLPNFNSTMVRLKAVAVGKTIPLFLDFCCCKATTFLPFLLSYPNSTFSLAVRQSLLSCYNSASSEYLSIFLPFSTAIFFIAAGCSTTG